MNLYEILDEPFSSFLPSCAPFCKREDINKLHKETCKILGIDDIYPEIVWSFTDKLRDAFAVAEYWADTEGQRHWHIKYDTRKWIAMGSESRKNTIIHEVCHLAVEKIYGHGKKDTGEVITDHGKHWQDLMRKCQESPFPEVYWCYR